MRRLKLAALLLAALLLTGLMPLGALAQGFSEAQRAEIVDILRRALRDDPSILRDAIGGLEAAEQESRGQAQRAALAAQADALFRDPADPVKGNPRGDVTLVEFFDARCGYCKQLHPTMEALIRRDPNLRVVMKDLPILGPNSVLASRALLAAQRQGRYGPLYDALMGLRGEPTEAVIRQQAERAGLDWTRLRRDMDDPAVQARIDGNLRLARVLGIEGTPALVVGTTLVPGAVDLPALERLVAEARAAR
jgi:protein-disulfide isomerase